MDLQNDALGGTGSVPPFFQGVAALGLKFLDAKYVQPKVQQYQNPQEVASGLPQTDPLAGKNSLDLSGPLKALASNPLVQLSVIFGVVLIVVLSVER